MTSRNNQIKLIQILLLIISLLIIFYTYFDKQIKQEGIISSTDKKRIKTDVTSSASDIFYNIKYSGIDLSGNRYVLTSKEAFVNESFQEIVTMNYVNAIFYFKDNTKLIIDSEKVYTIIKRLI